MSQHATFATPAARRSVVVHLIGLHLVLERGMKGQPSGADARTNLPRQARRAGARSQTSSRASTIASLVAAADLEDHDRRGRAWALSVWTEWAPHHARIRALAEEGRRGGVKR